MIETIGDSWEGWLGLVRLKNSPGKNHQTREDQGFQREDRERQYQKKEKTWALHVSRCQKNGRVVQIIKNDI